MPKPDPFSALCAAFLLPLVEAFLVQHGWSPSRLGREAVKDPSKVFLLRKGQEVEPKTARAFIAVIEKAAPGFPKKFVKKHAMEVLRAA